MKVVMIKVLHNYDLYNVTDNSSSECDKLDNNKRNTMETYA